MSLPLMACVAVAVLALGYNFYGQFVARQYRLDDGAVTPAMAVNDGIDFVPTRPFYLLGQHFSAIAAAGPIAGPILACQQFGWLPCLLWIGLGVVFIGAVHDFSSLVASVRHRGQSIAEIVKDSLGRRAGLAIMLFIWLALIYVIVAFTQITASTFVSGGDDFAGAQRFNPGGAVALASVLYLLLAVVMGVVDRVFHPPLWLQTIVFVPAVLVVVWFGTQLSTLLLLGPTSWGLIILAYCFVASLVPVWALLQPRGYLGGFVLYLALFVGVVGILFGGFSVEQPAFKGWQVGGPSGSLFPFLFVTIACGACSGFHGLVCSGTTSKQIRRESDCRPIGYGAMLLEGFVAVIALATIMMVSAEDAQGQPPGVLYGTGLGRFLAVMIGEQHLVFAVTFGAMAFSTFVFDTLDVSTRLGRYIVQELLGWRDRRGAILATLATVLPPAVLVVTSREDSYRVFWTLFGTSNQLLAALTLLAVSVWLHRCGRRYWFTLVPMLFVMTITLWALVLQGAAVAAVLFNGTVPAAADVLNGLVALALFGLAGLLIADGGRALMSRSPSELSEAA
jgi:carbon starvation protein